MTYSPNSNNPRYRRAYADNKLAQLKHGKATYQETYEAVFAASKTRKGKESGYVQRLGAAGVVLFDWSATAIGLEQPGIVQHDFGGYVMPREDAEHWAALGHRIKVMVDSGPRDFSAQQEPALSALYREHNKRFDMGYEAVMFTKMFRGSYANGHDIFPGLNDIFNPLEYEDVTPIIDTNNVAAVETRIAQLG